MVRYRQPSRAAPWAPYWLIPIPCPQPWPNTLTGAFGVLASATLAPPAGGQSVAAVTRGDGGAADRPAVALATSGAEATSTAVTQPRAKTWERRRLIARGLL